MLLTWIRSYLSFKSIHSNRCLRKWEGKARRQHRKTSVEHQSRWPSLLISPKHCVLHWWEVLAFLVRGQYVFAMAVAQIYCEKAGSCSDLVTTVHYNQSCFFGCCHSSLRCHCLLMFYINSLIKLSVLPTSVNATQVSHAQLITTLKATQPILLLPGLSLHLSYREDER